MTSTDAFGSRAPTPGVLAGPQLLVTPVVQGLHNLDVGPEAVLGIAPWKLAPKDLLNGLPGTSACGRRRRSA